MKSTCLARITQIKLIGWVGLFWLLWVWGGLHCLSQWLCINGNFVRTLSYACSDLFSISKLLLLLLLYTRVTFGFVSTVPAYCKQFYQPDYYYLFAENRTAQLNREKNLLPEKVWILSPCTSDVGLVSSTTDCAQELAKHTTSILQSSHRLPVCLMIQVIKPGAYL